MEISLGGQKSFVGDVMKNVGGPANIFCDVTKTFGGQKKFSGDIAKSFCDVSGGFCDVDEVFFGGGKNLSGALDETLAPAAGGLVRDEAKVCAVHVLGVFTRGWVGRFGERRAAP